MDISGFQIALLAALAAALVYACWTDWTSRTIPNALTAGIALAAPLFWVASDLSVWPDMAIQLAIGIVFFALFAGLFALGQMGGGDVKLIAALALWFPLFSSVDLVIIMALLGGVLTAVLWIGHKLRKSDKILEIPYGLAIAMAGLWTIYERYLNHFG